MKSCAEVPARALSKVITTAPSGPVPANNLSLAASSVRRNWGVWGLKKLRGCGSKVTASAGRVCARLICSARAITARWPRCTPSKLPSATTVPLGIAAAGVVSLITVKPGVISGVLRRSGLGAEPWRGDGCEVKPGPNRRAAFGISASGISALVYFFGGARLTGCLTAADSGGGRTAGCSGRCGLEGGLRGFVGSAARKKMRHKKYCLVISDRNMEPMTGYDLLREVRADPNLATTPFIMITAESKTENVIAAKKAGVNNYIVKPFNAATLKTKIEAVFPDMASA